MITTIRQRIITVVLAALLLLAPALALSLPATAATPNPQADLCRGVNNLSLTSTENGTDCTGAGAAESTIDNIVSYVINIFSIIVGIVAVIMIIVGGLKYITSGGDSNKVTSAKNSIVYAIIGLIIVALAQIIVKFVLAKATQA